MVALHDTKDGDGLFSVFSDQSGIIFLGARRLNKPADQRNRAEGAVRRSPAQLKAWKARPPANRVKAAASRRCSPGAVSRAMRIVDTMTRTTAVRIKATRA